jgi:NAD(P)-dependent dehydrogenase (short-subunit alcohol dehydrogenase family)
MMRLANKLVVISAAASGMGKSGCEIFTREGATVVGIDVNAEALAGVQERINKAGGQMHTIVADLSREDECRRSIADAAEKLGGIDVFWCHAGTPGPAGIENIDMDKYRFAMDLNLTSAVVMTGDVVSHMRARGGGSIIYTSSVGGLVGSMTSPVYSAAKFAIVGLAKSVAQDYARYDIRVNALCPGAIDTPMHIEFMARGAPPEVAAENRRKTMASIPMGRAGRPEDVAYAALWLAGDESLYVTGAAIPIDGGFTCR